eukprot:CAMPEP_0115855512 /NCGR_PEP_ID=MMETSP0287-20121206/14579_1 /TAXON_ID=412157 /ORGANISM="Chrysochromulina rotalis, Strain UIO044" /LENGTH=342 /DNA_ID=CAMNT_0003309665 /DNA_START=80 /DNA_END=1108 /DNA_ORIENTATION=-
MTLSHLSSSTPISQLPPIADMISCTPSTQGMGGVMFLQWAVATTVLKAAANHAEVVSAFFCQNVCSIAGVYHPSIEVLELASRVGQALVQRIGVLVNSSNADSEQGARLHAQHRKMIATDAVLIMEFIDGHPLLPEDAAAQAEQDELGSQVEAAAKSLGRIMAVDLTLNNWDRLPIDGFGPWRPDPAGFFAPEWPGNPDNLMRRASDGTIVAIDTDMKVHYSCPGGGTLTTDEYLRQLTPLLTRMAGDRPSELAMRVRDGLAKIRPGVWLSTEALLAFDCGFMSAFDALAAGAGPGDGGADAMQAAYEEAKARAGMDDEPAALHVCVERAKRVVEAWREQPI